MANPEIPDVESEPSQPTSRTPAQRMPVGDETMEQGGKTTPGGNARGRVPSKAALAIAKRAFPDLRAAVDHLHADRTTIQRDEEQQTAPDATPDND